MSRCAPRWRPRAPKPPYAFAAAQPTTSAQNMTMRGTTTRGNRVTDCDAGKLAGVHDQFGPMAPVSNTRPKKLASTPAGTVEPTSSRGTAVVTNAPTPTRVATTSQPTVPRPNAWEATSPPTTNQIPVNSVAATSPADGL